MIYADNAATTKMSPVALAAMLPALEDNYGNPSSLHSVGQHAAELLQSAREAMARCLNCKPREILFTSGGRQSGSAVRFGVGTAEGQEAHHLHHL